MTARTIPESAMDWSHFDNHRRVQVVGSQYHQPALLTASKGLIRQHTDRCEREATLLREPSNPHDSKAVQVMVDGKRVGFQAHLQIPYESELLKGYKSPKRSS